MRKAGIVEENQSTESTERSNTSSTHKKCCEACFGDYAISAYISSLDLIGSCDFCGANSENVIPVDKLARFIDKGIVQKYEDAAESITYVSVDGGYQMDTLSLAEILLYEEEVFDENILSEPDGLAKMISGASKFDTVSLVRKNPYGEPSGADIHHSTWDIFCERLKHSSRFMMFVDYKKHRAARHANEMPPGDPDDEKYRLNEFWYSLEEFMVDLKNLMLPAEMPIYRARLALNNEAFGHGELTSPPREHTRDGRMSPRGISCFYGGLEPETCIAEMRPQLAARVALAEFRTRLHLYVLDLTEIPRSKSVFDLDYYWFERDEFFIPFIRKFADTISQPVQPNEEAIAYLPTQAFCEFLQYLRPGYLIQGLKYRSAMRTGGSCLVLFKGPEISLNANGCLDSRWLEYIGVQYVKVNSLEYHTKVVKPD